MQAGHQVRHQVGADGDIPETGHREFADAARAIKQRRQLGLHTRQTDIGVRSRVVNDPVRALPTASEPRQLDVWSQTRPLDARIHRASQRGENVGHDKEYYGD